MREVDGSLTVTAFKGGKFFAETTNAFTKDYHYSRGARLIGLAPRELQQIVREFRDTGKTDFSLAADSPTVASGFSVRNTVSGDRTHFPTFAEALNAGIGELIEWEDAAACCALDLDFHGTTAPDVTATGQSVLPRPSYWWVTRSGGLRLIYLASDVPANDLAAVAAITVIARHPTGRIELLTRTRCPPSTWFSCVQSDDREAIRKLFGQSAADETEAAEWLAERGYAVGQRYSHDCCPVNPSPRAQGNAEPVVVYGDHIHCYICAADGVTFGSSTAGHFPLGALLGARIDSAFKTCVINLTHWGHARLVLADMFHSEPLLRAVYSAALNYVHGDDPRIPSVFGAGEGLVRFEGYWADEYGTPVQFRGGGVSSRIAALPRCKVLTEEGVATSPAIAECLMQTGDLSRYGYPPVTPVYGFHLTRFLPPPPGKTIYPIPSKVAARYLERSARVPDAWGKIDAVFPGINRDVLRLLLAAKGCAESGAGIEPMLFFTGPAGAGKTASVKIAASMLADRATSVIYTGDDDRLRAGLLSAKRCGSFAVFDEFFKGARRKRIPPDVAMEVLLNFTRDSVSHVLYIGPVAIGALPVCVWSDTTLPREVSEHTQIARRVVHIPLRDRVQWETTLRDTGAARPEDIRAYGGQELQLACDTIVSEVVDDFFVGSSPVFRDVARALGFRYLEEADTMTEKIEAIRAFFRLVCDAPPLPERYRSRWSGSGWKLIDLAVESDLVEAWRALADASGKGSRSIDEMDLRQVLRLKYRARLSVTSAHGSRIAVRFESVDPEGVVNADLLELEPVFPRTDGLGNAIPNQPADGGSKSVPTGFIDAVAKCGI